MRGLSPVAGPRYYWRAHLAVILGAAVTTAVLAGALVVGDSVRGSLADLTRARLGAVDHALLTERFLGAGVAAELAALPGFRERFEAAVPAVLLAGTAVAPGSGRRAAGVQVVGVEEGFAGLFAAADLDFGRRPGQLFPSAILNSGLAAELGAAVGEDVLLSFERAGEVPRATLLGERDPAEVVGSLRLTVVEILPDRPGPTPARFGLSPHQALPHNAFVELPRLQRALGRPGEVNAVLVAGRGEGARAPEAAPRLAELLAGVLAAEDLELEVRSAEGGSLDIASRELVLRPAVAALVEEVAADLGAPALPVLTYLANEMRVGDRSVPYSTVTALPLPPPFGELRLVDESGWQRAGETDRGPRPVAARVDRERTSSDRAGETDQGPLRAVRVEDDGILLDAWTARELAAGVGDRLEMTYYEVAEGERLETRRAEFTVAGVVAMAGLAVDRRLAPELPGIQDAPDMAAWEPPFPVDLERVGPRDEAYWDEYGAAPKAFVSLATGQRLWSSRFGRLTAVRLAPPPGRSPAELEAAWRRALAERLRPAELGLTFQPVKAEGLEAARGATDFGGLFLGFSMFLLAAAVLLVGLLFRLGVERRARELGLLLAVGYPRRAVARRFLAEGALLAGVGVALGLAGAAAYAALMLAGLRTLWLPAVGSSQLFLHLRPATLALGGGIAFAAVLLTVAWTARRLARLPAARLLAGETAPEATAAGPGPLARWLPPAALGLAVVLLMAALATGAVSSPAFAFGTGAALLVAGLGFFARWCRRGGAALGVAAPSLAAERLRMAARASARQAGRSTLAVILVAAATFVIVAVAANRREFRPGELGRDSGAGGFELVAEAATPLYQPLGDAAGRAELGFGAAREALLARCEIFALRLRPGDDASCLNLYRPRRPRLLGVPRRLVERGGFGFQAVVEERENPWTLLADDLGAGAVPAIGDANSVRWILHSKLGGEVVVEDGRGEPLRLRLVGLLAKSVFQSELLISEERFLEHFPDRGGAAFFLVDTPPGEAGAVVEALESTLAGHGLDAASTAERLASYQAVENTYLSTFQLLGGLGLLLGTLGLGVILWRNVLERRGELATLRAFGFRRATLAWLVLAENAFLLLVGIALGAAAALVAVAPHLLADAAPVPWPSLALTLAAVLAAGMLASATAVRAVLRVPLLPALKEER